jgi:hypothetical protein
MNYMRKVNGVWHSTVTMFGDNGLEAVQEATQEEETDQANWEPPTKIAHPKSGSSKRRARKAAYNLRRQRSN